AEERHELVARAVWSDRADRRDPRAERVGVVRSVRSAAEEHLPLGEAQDEHGSFSRDSGRLAEEILVEDQVADDHDVAPGEGIDGGTHGLLGRVHRESPSITQSAAASRSSATWSGCTGNALRRYSHSPRP